MSWNCSSSMAIAHPAASAPATGQGASPRAALAGIPGRAALPRGLDVLVDVERVIGVITSLDPGQPVIVAAVGRPDPVLALAHHEVDVAAAGRVGMQRLPVVGGPPRDGL